MNKRTISFLGTLLILSAAIAIGQTKTAAQPVKAELKQFKVVNVNGVESLQSAEKTKPGDVIEYVATYENTGKTAVHKVEGTIPVPSGMEYTPDAKLKAPNMAAANDGKFAPLPLKHKIQRNGVETEEVLPYSAYRLLKWNIGTLAPGQKAEVKARMKLSATR